jgi:hypothetical protein
LRVLSVMGFSVVVTGDSSCSTMKGYEIASGERVHMIDASKLSA